MRKIKIDPTCENIREFSVALLFVVLGSLLLIGSVFGIVKGLM